MSNKINRQTVVGYVIKQQRVIRELEARMTVLEDELKSLKVLKVKSKEVKEVKKVKNIEKVTEKKLDYKKPTGGFKKD